MNDIFNFGFALHILPTLALLSGGKVPSDRPIDGKDIRDLLFKPGRQEFLLTAPDEPGAYEVVCTVICSEDHEGMHMKFVVEP